MNVTALRVNLGKHSALQMKEVFLLCTCQSVSEGLKEHSVLLLLCACMCVCVEVGGSLDWKRQQGCTVRTTKPQRHCYCANGEPAIYADIFVRLSHRAKVKHFIVGKTARLTKH